MNRAVVIYDTTEISHFPFNISIIPNLIFRPSFSFATLLTSLTFDHKFKTGRLTQLFGNFSYAYGTVSHQPSSIQSNACVRELFDFVNLHFPNFKLNSCLINYYPSSDCPLPDHSDNEPCIEENSFIVTISLGTTRRMHFKSSNSGESLCSILLNDGHVLIFSRRSQCYFSHGIPAIVSTDKLELTPRISATFRCLMA